VCVRLLVSGLRVGKETRTVLLLLLHEVSKHSIRHGRRLRLRHADPEGELLRAARRQHVLPHVVRPISAVVRSGQPHWHPARPKVQRQWSCRTPLGGTGTRLGV
jgi:hypothetical protein